jgi:fatty acid-binding protein DegV
MVKVGIITDRIHGLSRDLIQKYDIRIAPMGVVINNKVYRDTIDIMTAQFSSLFKEAKTPTLTNAVSPGEFLGIA